ncbi:MAG: hypothetical protein MK171_09950 [Pirellulales bacterium]|nr:hypothetical protein [Pirellulales bacterium]
MFCHVSRSLKSVMLCSVEMICESIARITITTGLRVAMEMARKLYQWGIKSSHAYLEQELAL